MKSIKPGRQPSKVSAVMGIFMAIAGKGDLDYIVYNLLGGGLLIGAIFMATDYATCPLTSKGNSDKRKALIEYDPSPEAVFGHIIPHYISGIIYGGVCESIASELSARRSAMENATDNAGEIIDSLSLTYNRARQAAITQEITEIVAGSNQ